MYNPKGVKEYFNDNPELEWEQLEKNIHGRVKFEVTKHILLKHLPKKGHILDAGCGPGRYAIELTNNGYQVTLVDISIEQLKLAKKKIAEMGRIENILDSKCLDICDLSNIPNAQFDAVICLGGGISYVRDMRHQAISELIRVAKPGSPIIVGVMSLLGTFHVISHFDHARFLTEIMDHIDWNPETPLPAYVNSKFGSNQWHAPMTLYSSSYMKEFFEEHDCQVLEMAASNTVTSSYWDELENIASNPEATEVLMRLERELCTKPGVVDMGEHLIVVAQTPT